MSSATQRQKWPLLAISILLCLVVSMVWASQAGLVHNTGDSALQRNIQVTTPLEKKLLSFTDINNGAVEVRDIDTNTIVQVFGSGEGSFVRGILRSLTRERRAKGLSQDTPFELRVESQHRLVLLDQATGTTLLLNAFGPNNVATFAQFLEQTPVHASVQ